MKERKHNYVVGYIGENQCAYGKDKDDRSDWVNLMTLYQAKRKVKTLLSAEVDRAIYKLVPVEVVKGKKDA